MNWLCGVVVHIDVGPRPKLSSIGHAIVQVDDSVAEVLLIEQVKGKSLVAGEGLFAAS